MTKIRLQTVPLADSCFLEAFMDADRPSFTKGVACRTRRVVYQGFKENPSVKDTIWSTVFIIQHFAEPFLRGDYLTPSCKMSDLGNINAAETLENVLR